MKYSASKTSVKTIAVALLGWSFISFIFLSATLIILWVLALLLNLNSIVVDVYGIKDAQRVLYKNTRNIWQSQNDCVDLNPELVYEPRPGPCRFANIEFDTTLNFDGYGRAVPARDPISNYPSGGAVAIIGDSHAMGWGVADEETFANVLQQRLQRPVVNLAVSSYGTERELLRLLMNPIYELVDTIVLQYCDNDLSENTSQLQDFSDRYRSFASHYLDDTQDPRNRSVSDYIAQNFRWQPFRNLLEELVPMFAREPLRILWYKIKNFFGRNSTYYAEGDFQPHYDQLSKILTKYGNLLEGRSIIVIYVNSWGQKYNNFKSYNDTLNNVTFVDLNTDPEKHFFTIDDHMTPSGHRHVGNELAKLLSDGAARK